MIKLTGIACSSPIYAYISISRAIRINSHTTVCGKFHFPWAGETFFQPILTFTFVSVDITL